MGEIRNCYLFCNVFEKLNQAGVNRSIGQIKKRWKPLKSAYYKVTVAGVWLLLQPFFPLGKHVRFWEAGHLRAPNAKAWMLVLRQSGQHAQVNDRL